MPLAHNETQGLVDIAAIREFRARNLLCDVLLINIIVLTFWCKYNSCMETVVSLLQHILFEKWLCHNHFGKESVSSPIPSTFRYALPRYVSTAYSYINHAYDMDRTVFLW